VLHTPGHTPEHLTFLITDAAVADRPIAAITGDFVFVGDVGRPDLLEKAAKIAGTMESGARTLWRSLQQFQQYPDWLQIWPGHGAGSACGKGISAVPHSTLGYERRFNWAFTAKTEAEFVANVLSGQPDPPPYFAVMKRINKEGPSPVSDRPVPRIADDKLAQTVSKDLVIDTRPAEEFAKSHVPGTLNIPLGGSFITWAGWLIPSDQDFYVVTDRIDDVRRALGLIGLDRIAGVFPPAAAAGNEQVPQVSADELKQRLQSNDLVVVDVRNDNEWKEGRIAEAIHIPLRRYSRSLAERTSRISQADTEPGRRDEKDPHRMFDRRRHRDDRSRGRGVLRLSRDEAGDRKRQQLHGQGARSGAAWRRDQDQVALRAAEERRADAGAGRAPPGGADARAI
jgi:hydroxyacylglutathione hydrolase